MCGLAEFILQLVDRLGLGVVSIGVVIIGLACLIVLHPSAIRPVMKIGRMAIWSNHILFDPRKCGICAILNWLVLATILFLLISRKYC